MATPQTPRARRSPLARYAPLIAVVVVVAIVAVVIGVASGGKKQEGNALPRTTPTGKAAFSDVPIFYNEAKAKGTLGKYTWQPNCDTTTGQVAIPILNPPPCVPALAAGTTNGGATSPGVTADTIKIGYYIAPPDPHVRRRSSSRRRVRPARRHGEQAYKDYVQIYATPVRAVRPQGPARAASTGTGEHRRGGGQGRRRQGGRCRRVRRHRRSRAGAAASRPSSLASKVLCIASCVTSAPRVDARRRTRRIIWPHRAARPSRRR